jgi:hypothetical protein
MLKKLRKTRSPRQLVKAFAITVAGLLVFTALAVPTVLALNHWWYLHQHAAEFTARSDRILAIYKSLQLPSDYDLRSDHVFGDKRVYDWDPSRTYSSSRVYLRYATSWRQLQYRPQPGPLDRHDQGKSRRQQRVSLQQDIGLALEVAVHQYRHLVMVLIIILWK